MTATALHPCAACGFLVHAHAAGSGGTCPACGWIDDYEQLVHPDLTYGANSGTCLREAQRRALQRHPREHRRWATRVRDETWRPLHAGETPVADPGGPSSPVCHLGAPDPADFVPYWKRSPGR